MTNFDWHLLSKNEQKLYLMALPHVQQEEILYIAKVWPLNMERSLSVSSSFVRTFFLFCGTEIQVQSLFFFPQIFKSIYSYAMVLRRML